MGLGDIGYQEFVVVGVLNMVCGQNCFIVVHSWDAGCERTCDGGGEEDGRCVWEHVEICWGTGTLY